VSRVMRGKEKERGWAVARIVRERRRDDVRVE
jgi:hypothetical protein